MYEPASRYTPNLLFLWPAFAAASLSEFNAFAARQFADLAAGRDHLEIREPAWATQHTIALELQTVRMRCFGAGNQGQPTLLCAPFSLHGSSITDLAPDHSLVEALLRAGIQRLFVTDWRSATKEMSIPESKGYRRDDAQSDHRRAYVGAVGGVSPYETARHQAIAGRSGRRARRHHCTRRPRACASTNHRSCRFYAE
jgi:hypothetical protein